jgi:glycine dehydrogenase subunit 1
MPYIQHTPEDIARMLRTVGVETLDELFDALPAEVRAAAPLHLPPPLDEPQLLRHAGERAFQNRGAEGVCFLGGGCYDHFIPPAVDALSGRGEFYTAYTPYQPEASQGILQAFFEYQTLIARLTGMEISNASLYDGASALAEAALMAHALGRRKGKRILVSGAVHPEYIQTLETYLRHIDVTVEILPLRDGVTDASAVAGRCDKDVAAVAAASPNGYGLLEDLGPLAEAAHGCGALLIAVADPVGLGILKPPGAFGADIVVGEGQGLGNPMSFGGPHFGFLAAREKAVRSLPGRVVGMTQDSRGRRGFVLTFQTREQHIRREKATSNICTNQALCALRAAVHLALLGPEGLQGVAARCADNAHALAERLCALPGVSLRFPGPFFKEFLLRLPGDAEDIARGLSRRGFHVGPSPGRWNPELGDCLLVAVTERRTSEEMEALHKALGEELGGSGRA